MTPITQIIAAGIAGLAAVGASWMTANATADARVSEIDKKIEVVEERENNHYLEVKQSLERIEKKIDQL